MSIIEEALNTRPLPPAALIDIESPATFVPAPAVLEWARANIIGDGPLYNEEHNHLLDAHIGILWTNVPNSRHGRRIVGQCEIPNVQGGKWLKSRVEQQLIDWFDAVPDFLITLDALFAVEANNATWCAYLEHELYHAGQSLDEFGAPAFNSEGRPKFAIRGHDFEGFHGVTRRYGVGAAESGVAEMVRIAQMPPEIAQARIDAACGTCLR